MFSFSFPSAYKHCATLKGITLLISTLTKERRDHDLVLVKSENSYSTAEGATISDGYYKGERPGKSVGRVW